MSKLKNPIQRLLVPDSQYWCVLDERGDATEVEEVLPSAVDTLAVPAAAIVWLPIWVQSNAIAIAGDAVRLQLETRRLIREGDPAERLCVWRVLRTEQDRQLLAVQFLQETAFETSGISEISARRYISSAECRNLPKNCVALWYEQGQPTVAIVDQTGLTHFQVLASGSATSLAFQLSCIVEQLVGEEVLERVPHSWIIDSQSPDAELLGKAIKARMHRTPGVGRIKFLASPVSDPRPTGGEWLPANEAIRRSDKKRSGTRVRVVASLLAGYLLIVATLGFKLWHLDRSVNRQNLRLGSLRPPVIEITGHQQAWSNLVGATDTSRYPLEILARCVDQLPPNGVELTHFELADDGTLKIAGSASSVADVLVFKEAITRATALASYAWNFPPPRNAPEGNGASFQASATPVQSATETLKHRAAGRTTP